MTLDNREKPIHNADMEAKVTEKTTTFPSIKDGFQQTWDRLTPALLQLVFITLLSYAGFAVLFLICALLGLASGVLPPLFRNEVPSFSPFSIIMLVVAFIVFLVGAIIIGAVQQTGSLLILGSKAKQPLGDVVKKSLILIIPLALTNILSGLLQMGGTFLFIIPGILFAIFLGFAPYIVVFENLRNTAALKRSYNLVTHNFGPLVVRWLVFFIIYLFIVFLPNIISSMNETAGGMFSIIGFFVNFLLGWFAIAYGIMLYEYAKTATPTNKNDSIKWLVITSAIGWVVGVLLLLGTISLLANFARSLPQRGMPNINREQSYDEMYQDLENEFPGFEEGMEALPTLPQTIDEI